jgi:cation:H+ antiporter
VGFDIILLIVSFILIAKGGDIFVDSSVHIGRALNIPRFIVGGTLMSLATTIPELVVSVTASGVGDSGIALGNAVGSCICNIGLIVGMVAVIVPVGAGARDFANRALWMSVGGALVVIFSLDLTLSRPLGIVLLVMSLVYLLWDYRSIRRLRAGQDRTQRSAEERATLVRSINFFALGASLIIVGSWLLVTSGQSVATALGLPSAIIGFSVIAIGTSLPELVTGVSAARKGVPDLSLGNIMGANVLNLFLIVGVSGTIQPLELDGFTQWYAFPWMAIIFGTFIFLVRRNGHIGRWAGLSLLILYVVYSVGLFALPALGLVN